jgi:tRNA nucleotidyltransferase (CCA-adding enzyme)
MATAARINTRATEKQLRELANRLAPSANSKRENNAVVHALISTLNQLTMPEGVKVSRSKIAGSQGKGSSLEGSDIDFVRYVAMVNQPICHLQATQHCCSTPQNA